MSNDPLLQPYQLKHLTLRNRIMSTAHEPSYSENGLPGERYRRELVRVPTAADFDRYRHWDGVDHRFDDRRRRW